LLASRHTAPTPILFVWVARGSSESEPWRSWMGRPGVDRCSVGPLPVRSIRAILRSWIHLDETDIVEIARQAAGHVAVARQRVEAFLRDGTHRTVLVRPAEAARMDAVLTDDGDERALELAATMGQVVSVAQWRKGAQVIGAARDDAWLRRISAEGLVVRLARRGADAPEQFRFATPGIRQALLERARSADRLRELYQVTVGDQLTDPPNGRWTWGEQLAEAGLDELAGAAWLAAAIALSDRGDPAGASVTASHAQRLAERTAEREVAARAALFRSRCAIERGALDEVTAPPEGAGWDPRVVKAFLLGEGQVPGPSEAAEGILWRGRALLRAGDVEAAVETWLSLRERRESYAGLALVWAARARMWCGDRATALALLETVGSRDRFAAVRQEQGALRAEIARADGRLAEAATGFAEVVEQRLASGGLDAVRVQLQLAVLHTLAGRHVEADPLIQRASVEAIRREDPGHRRFAGAAAALAALALEDDARLEVAVDALIGSPFDADPEVHATLARLAETLTARGHDEDAAALGAELAVWRARAGRAFTALRWWDPTP
ncbi:MAG: hypothetical protein AAF602_23630, partial [Myxococcota bacterium]